MAMAIMFVGATVQGSIGFGANLIAAPVLALIDVEFLPAPLIINAFVLTALGWRREHTEVDRRAVGWSLVGRVPGSLAGALAVVLIEGDALGVLFGVLILLAVALSVSGLRLTLRPTTLALAGAASGLMGTATSIGGPPVALAYQDLPGARLRATLSAFAFVGVCISLTLLTALGATDLADLRRAAVLVPATIVGFAVSSRLRPLVDRGWIRPAILALSAVSSLALIVRAVV